MQRRAALPSGIAMAVQDRAGRIVTLTEVTMERHIERRHVEMRGYELAIATTLETGIRYRAGQDGREKFFARQLGPGKWLAVVVAYSGRTGRVITAYADKNGPKEADRI